MHRVVVGRTVQHEGGFGYPAGQGEELASSSLALLRRLFLASSAFGGAALAVGGLPSSAGEPKPSTWSEATTLAMRCGEAPKVCARASVCCGSVGSPPQVERLDACSGRSGAFLDPEFCDLPRPLPPDTRDAQGVTAADRDTVDVGGAGAALRIAAPGARVVTTLPPWVVIFPDQGADSAGQAIQTALRDAGWATRALERTDAVAFFESVQGDEAPLGWRVESACWGVVGVTCAVFR